ncbi:MAG: hypothetical protein V3T88_00405, partial [Nitrosomonadaceae bacterium]
MRSCINEETYYRLNLKLKYDNLPKMRTANGSDLGAMGHVTIDFLIAGRKFSQNFIVCREMRRAVILGRDFAIPNYMGVAWTPKGTKKLTQDDELVIELPEPAEGIALATTKRCVVPPRGWAIAEIDSTHPLEGQLQVNTAGAFAEEQPNLYCTPLALANVEERTKGINGAIPYLMMNLSSHEQIYIPKNKVVAFAKDETEEVDYIEVCEVYDDIPFDEIQSKMLGSPKLKPKEELPHMPPIPENDFILSMEDANRHRKVELKDIENISPEIRERFEKLCEEQSEVISKNNEDIGHTKVITMNIDTGLSPPVCQKPYSLALKHYEWVQKEIETLERAGVIEKSLSPWASPIVVVPKKSAP